LSFFQNFFMAALRSISRSGSKKIKNKIYNNNKN